MNPQIATLFRLCAAGFAVLISMTAYWQIWAAPSLAVRQDNARLVYRQLQVKRGLIYASDGRTVLAADRKVHRNGQTLYLRRYPYGSLFAHVVGYNTIGQGRTGLELSENDYLTRSNVDLSTILGNLGNQLRGQTVTGDNLYTSLSLPTQRAAMRGLTGLRGAVVALEPSTGRVLALASSPSFDPSSVGRNLARLGNPAAGAPLLDRALQGLYAPGSTFKAITATAALDSRLYTPLSTIDGHGTCITIQTVPLCNAGGESAGVVTLTDALTFSYNTVFAQVGERVGATRLEDYMTRFGFFARPPMDFPTDEMAPSGLYSHGRLLPRSAPVDVARVAIGQERLGVTPFQMAEVAATIANGGVRMRPTLVDRAVAPGGGTAFTTRAQPLGRVMSPTTASELTQMMRRVVEEGTGTAANIGNLGIAGKTGTAETGVAGLNTAWFIAFAPYTNPKIAVAVTIERTSQFGGTIAAPVARDVIAAYLASGVAK